MHAYVTSLCTNSPSIASIDTNTRQMHVTTKNTKVNFQNIELAYTALFMCYMLQGTNLAWHVRRRLSNCQTYTMVLATCHRTEQCVGLFAELQGSSRPDQMQRSGMHNGGTGGSPSTMLGGCCLLPSPSPENVPLRRREAVRQEGDCDVSDCDIAKRTIVT